MSVIEISLPGIKEIIQKLELIDANLASIRKEKPLNEVWLTTKEAAIALKVSTRTIQNYRDQGTLSFSQFGREVRFKAEDIQQFLNDHYVSARVNGNS